MTDKTRETRVGSCHRRTSQYSPLHSPSLRLAFISCSIFFLFPRLFFIFFISIIYLVLTVHAIFSVILLSLVLLAVILTVFFLYLSFNILSLLSFLSYRLALLLNNFRFCLILHLLRLQFFNIHSSHFFF